MPNPLADLEKREAFLSVPRLAILMTNRKAPAPIGVPVWFEWNGETVEMFAGVGTLKTKRLEQDPHASVLVTNHIDEPEAWVAFDGTIEIKPGGVDLVARLAEHYWDLNDPAYRKVLDGWLSVPEAFCLMTLTPTKIRSGG